MGILSGASITISPRYELFFLRPTDSALGPSEDTVVDGELTLTLQSAKKVKRIDVELVREKSARGAGLHSNNRGELTESRLLPTANVQIGTQSMTIHSKYVSYPTLQHKITIDLLDGTGTLDAGVHAFSWSFVVQATTAPHDRLGEFEAEVPRIPRDVPFPHGGHVRAKTKHKVRVTAPGCGNFGSDLVQETALCLQAIGEWSQGFSRVEELQHPVLGPLRVHLFTRYLLVAGFLKLTLNVPEIEEDCEIVDVTVTLVQQVHLRDHSRPDIPEEVCKPHAYQLWSLEEERSASKEPRAAGGEGDLPSTLRKGEAFQLARIMRLPSDNVIRQSTPIHSKTGIRVSHTVAAALQYRRLSMPAETKELRIRFDCAICSCDCVFDNLQLPDYALAPPPKGKGRVECLCELSALTDKERLKLYGMDDMETGGHQHGTFVPRQQPPTKWEEELAASAVPGGLGPPPDMEAKGQAAINELMR